MVNDNLLKNILKRLIAISILLKPIIDEKVSNTAKSSYYRSAIILSCTIVEGLVYELVRLHSQPNGYVIGTKSDYKNGQPISNRLISEKDVYLCKKVFSEVLCNDRGVTFEHYNIYLRDQKVISRKEFTLLEAVRRERNKIHIQGLDKEDSEYTKRMVNKCTKPIMFLMNKIENYM